MVVVDGVMSFGVLKMCMGVGMLCGGCVLFVM